MSKNTCMRCGSECAPGEIMCSSCQKWLEEKKGSAKKTPALGTKPTATPASAAAPAAPAAKAAGGFGASRLSRLRGEKATPAADPVAEAPAAPAVPVEAAAPVQEYTYTAPVESVTEPAYTAPASPVEEPVKDLPAAEPVNAAPAWTYATEDPLFATENETPAASAPAPAPEQPAAPKTAKIPGVSTARDSAKAAAAVKLTKPAGTKNASSFLPTDPAKRKQTLMMIGIVAAVVVIAILMIVIFGGNGKAEVATDDNVGYAPNTAEPSTDHDTGNTGYEPDYEPDDDFGTSDNWDEPTPEEPGYEDAGLPGISLIDLSPQVSNGGFYFYDYGEDNVGGWYTNSIGGAESDTENWCEYWIGGEYAAISGTVYLNYEYRNETAKHTVLEIYGDGQLLYRSNIVTAGSHPQNFTVDLRGVRLLRVCIYGDAYLRLSDCRLYENMSDAPVYEQIQEELSAYIYEGGLSGYDRQYFSAASASSEIENNGTVYWASNAIDDDLTTSWQEDAEDDGIGEFLMLYFDREVDVELLCLRLGYATYFDRNGRPSALEFGFSDGSSAICYFDDANRDFYVKLSRPVTTSYIKLTIRGVYTGSHWDDTCITEVSAFSNGSGIATPTYQLDEGEPEFLGYLDPWDLVGTYSVQCATFSNSDSAMLLAEQTYEYALANNRPWQIYLLYKDPYHVVYFGPYDSKDYATLEKDIFNNTGIGEGDGFVSLNKEPEE